MEANHDRARSSDAAFHRLISSGLVLVFQTSSMRAFIVISIVIAINFPRCLADLGSIYLLANDSILAPANFSYLGGY